MAMVEFGGKFVKCWPLNASGNLICIALGSGELIWGIFIKFLPTKYFACMSLDDKPEDEEGNQKQYISTAIKRKKKSKTSEGGAQTS